MLTYDINNFFHFSKIGPDKYYTIIPAMKKKDVGRRGTGADSNHP